MCVAVLSESWLLDFREFLEEILKLSRGFDDLKGGEAFVHKMKDPLPLEVDAQVVGVEKVGAEEWTSNIGQDELVLEGDAGEV